MLGRKCGAQQLPAGRSTKHSLRLQSSRPKQRITGLRAVRSPCVVITAPDGLDNPSLQQLAREVRQQLGLQALVIAPATPAAPAPATPAAAAAAAATLSLEQQLTLHPDPTHELTFALAGATAADCVLCAVDQACGLLQALSLSPVLVLVGVSRGPALSSDMDTHPAVAVARQAALLGLPAVAACLATTTASAPMQPAVTATLQLLGKLLAVLQHSSSRRWDSSSSSSRGWSTAASARNFPRAHFPFPEEGRWALGTQMPLPHSAAAAAAQNAGGGSSSSRDDNKYDCWALGEDNSWLGESNSSRTGVSKAQQAAGGSGHAAAQQRAYQVLQGAFTDGDVLMCLNVPPTWREGSGFAATRPGVLWHCWQVEAHGQQQQQRQHRQVDTDGSSSRSKSGSSSSSSSSSRSWQVDSEDLFGRTLPSSSYGSQVPAGRNFVGQDNTQKVATEGRFAAWYSSGVQFGTLQPKTEQPSAQQQHGDPQDEGYGQLRGLGSFSSNMQHRGGTGHSHTITTANSSGIAESVVGGRHSDWTQGVPSSFVVQRGTLLSDAAACGDVEAVFSGKAAVTMCQVWPAGHPLSVRDELLLAALDDGRGGWPAWLDVDESTQ